MQPPITAGTVLQNRYRIVKTLGQGGFGRTYLAEDLRRFNELCAIKELIPVVTGGYAWKKAKELFEREAATLYQIQHPQVPQFREKFEQDQRLFLVQDYVAGKTYRALLDERKAVSNTGVFTEKEVLQLIQFMVPVLEHIHAFGIIHRDIAPDNIILRDKDNLPVLIDFGVVKELATRLRSPDHTMQATSVGKFGYAPSEQLQTGRAYPSSDLYALAVTSIVLLTGKEPQELLDDNHQMWKWERSVTVNPQLAKILNRMLSQKPSDRYQNAAAVKQALQTMQQSNVPNPNLSNVQTVAVGRRLDPVQSPPAPKKPDQVVQPPSHSSILDNPLAIVGMVIFVICLAGFTSWAIVSTIRANQSPQAQEPAEPQTFPSPVVPGGDNSETTPTPTPTSVNNEPVVFSKRLRFGESNTTTVEGTLKANETIRYTFRGEEGQQITVSLAQKGGVEITVLGPNREPIDNTAQRVTFYKDKLPFTGRYAIQLTPIPGVSQANYSLNIGLENPVEPTPTPTPTDSPEPTPPETSPSPEPTPPETPSSPELTPTETPPSPEPTEQPPSPPIDEQNNPPASSTPTPTVGETGSQ
ncbi:MAG: protein kinase [Scytonema sp. PMC 1069.18]|nr:protein kinase [Scytonema sp. PMC 1069.18]MEC4886909.1 protein kinase [Scytonema sp. PMC 1070.18]